MAVPPEVDVVLTEGNYLLLDRPEWRAGRAELDEVWSVRVDYALRLERLVARHIAFGKEEQEARRWVERVDEPNARLVDSGADSADLTVDLSSWGA